MAEGLGRLLSNRKVLVIGGVAGIALLVHELPLTHGSSDSDPAHAKSDKSVINCLATPKQEFALTEAPHEIKANHSGRVETLGFFAVKGGDVIHGWDSDTKAMAALGKSAEVRAYNGKFIVHTNGKKAQATVSCPPNQHTD